jgi:ribosomal protein S18 acetylase RimI-like enzyme
VPAETATTDERFARAVGFERRVHEQVSARVETLPYGRALLDDGLPRVPWANMLWVTANQGVDAARLVADADRILRGFAHRQLVIEHESLWRTIEPELTAAGWQREAILFMAHDAAIRPSGPTLDLSAVREVGHDDIHAAEDRVLRDDPETADGVAREQVMRRQRRIGELVGERCFATYAGDEVSAYAKLRHRGGVAQVEDVAVLPEHRGAGLGRLVTSAALAAGLALDPELLFLVADDDDWPKDLYERLGFAAVGATRGFLLPPPPDARTAATG